MTANPRQISNGALPAIFKHYAMLIQLLLEQNESRSISDDPQTGRLREEFIAVLGHDLRNPLAAIAAAIRILEQGRSDRAPSMFKIIRGSVDRMALLIDNVVDFARGRLGGGIHVHRKADSELWPLLHQVINELQNAHPTRVILVDIKDDGSVVCDRGRLGQLLSNLLGNALTHGAAHGDVKVTAGVSADRFEITVSNPGEPIPPDILQHLFEPFTRNAVRSSSQGLGLGLYIAAEIAKAHSGTLTATSNSQETCFRFSMPACASV